MQRTLGAHSASLKSLSVGILRAGRGFARSCAKPVVDKAAPAAAGD